MKKQLTHISPLRAGTVLGVLYGIMSLVVTPLMLLATAFGNKTSGTPAFGISFINLSLPLLYAAAGFIGGVIAAAVYNLAAKWTGGIEFEVKDVPPNI